MAQTRAPRRKANKAGMRFRLSKAKSAIVHLKYPEARLLELFRFFKVDTLFHNVLRFFPLHYNPWIVTM
jgi:hypothetical protein